MACVAGAIVPISASVCTFPEAPTAVDENEAGNATATAKTTVFVHKPSVATTDFCKEPSLSKLGFSPHVEPR